MTRNLSRFAVICAAFAAASGPALGDPDDDELIIDGEVIATEVAAPEDSPFTTLYSGWRFRTDETQALQMDDFDNPAMVLVDSARDQWEVVEGSEAKSCASCHDDVEESMMGIRAHYPKWNDAAGRPFTLENAINACRTERMGAEEWGWESPEMLGMTALIGLQSRGMPMKIDRTAGEMEDWIARGKEFYYTRFGQLNMACANCHEDHYGQMIRADHLSQGNINGFPTYRLKWQGVGSLHRRFAGCVKDTRRRDLPERLGRVRRARGLSRRARRGPEHRDARGPSVIAPRRPPPAGAGRAREGGRAA